MPDRIYIEQADAEALIALGALVSWDSPAAAAMGRLRDRLASESGEECERCGGEGSGPMPTTAGAEHGERSVPCPDCQPESGEEEDWPEVVLWRKVGHRGPVHAAPDLVGQPPECCRYIPAPEPEDDKLRKFDAWLSFRPEFAEVVKAFRSAFGTDTSAIPAPEGSETR